MKIDNKRFINRYLFLINIGLLLCISLTPIIFLLCQIRISLFIFIAILLLIFLQLFLIWDLRYVEVINSSMFLSIRKYHPFKKMDWKKQLELPFSDIIRMKFTGNQFNRKLTIILQRPANRKKIIKLGMSGLSNIDIEKFTSSVDMSLNDRK
ncbi:hypothetical protein QE441_002338 [Chryseobacterium sp. SORGH_AS909]|uniref:PH domain-containing protein n=2 Tax=Chryseobacterium group TaxID=2782232 RepID=A0ABU0TDV1_9FLAO|nr:hypothetical protein [Chryseobacterium camelliae]MDQ1099195.1 hypothetical protein [Chryseobacterium sp. SORGH_AS_1048]MDR6086544.1 hypothetical protein [Chryseobacterium sp. SORGH_AS_0909]MDR6130915.1 hypothetical protein [Chryseobacterium sp. SORGH_AS_1175]MDT3406950.1 hypothetical protein [Pseudacidovorax intermedius]